VTHAPGAPPNQPADTGSDEYPRKWLAFMAVGTSFVTSVMSVSMVFVALSAIADSFDITLRVVSWIVIAQALTISALMMPMGRLADIIGWKRVHLIGIVIYSVGAVGVALAPTFGLAIAARVVMSAGGAMGQAVGTAMIVAMFQPHERGNAIGSQTTAVAIGGASGPIIGGIVLQFAPWEALFLMLLVPMSVAFVLGSILLDDKRLQPNRVADRPPFDWGGALLSGLAITLLIITINNPRAEPWLSPWILGGLFGSVLLIGAFIRWEMRVPSPMLDLTLFQNVPFRLAVLTRLLGFMGTVATRFLGPVYLITIRGLEEGIAGAILFLISFGMGIAAQGSGRLTDRFGSRPFTIIGFGVLATTALPMAFLTQTTPMEIVMVLLFFNGFGMGLWNVPNNSVIMGSVPASRLGVVSALTNLTRNVGNVVGQAIAAGVIVAVMAAQGFDIPLSQVARTEGASDAFIAGWRATYFMVTGYALLGMFLAFRTKPTFEREAREAAAARRR
jgi:MFS family permease